MNQAMETIEKIMEILRSSYDDPAEQIIKEADTLRSIGVALKGKSPSECRAIMASAKMLLDATPWAEKTTGES